MKQRAGRVLQYPRIVRVLPLLCLISLLGNSIQSADAQYQCRHSGKNRDEFVRSFFRRMIPPLNQLSQSISELEEPLVSIKRSINASPAQIQKVAATVIQTKSILKLECAVLRDKKKNRPTRCAKSDRSLREMCARGPSFIPLSKTRSTVPNTTDLTLESALLSSRIYSRLQVLALEARDNHLLPLPYDSPIDGIAQRFAACSAASKRITELGPLPAKIIDLLKQRLEELNTLGFFESENGFLLRSSVACNEGAAQITSLNGNNITEQTSAILALMIAEGRCFTPQLFGAIPVTSPIFTSADLLSLVKICFDAKDISLEQETAVPTPPLSPELPIQVETPDIINISLPDSQPPAPDSPDSISERSRSR